MQSSDIKFGFKREVIEFGRFPQPFELDVGASSGKEMIGLGSHRLSR
jgi:hypothetical protein